MTQVKSITSLILELPPSCIEFSPQNLRWAVIGTYYLDKRQDAATSEESEDGGEQKQKQEQQRSGSLVLLDISDDRIQVIQTLPTPFAILDIHFTPANHGIKDLLAAATSTGSIALYSLTQGSADSNSSSDYLQHIRTMQLFDPSEIVTSFIWHPLHPGILATTLSTGAIHLCHLNLSSTSESEQNQSSAKDTAILLLTHDLEAWIAAFAPSGTALLTGGDDSTLRYYSLPSALSDSGNFQSALEAHDPATWIDRKMHTAGVTAILPLTASIAITGSYDDCIRVLSTPGVGRRQVLLEENLGGGVWRLQMLREFGDREGKWEGDVLASCMHAGARVLRIKRDGEGVWSLSIVARFEEHDSMNYGSDVQVRGEERVVVSTSFYDRLVCVWRIPEDEQ